MPRVELGLSGYIVNVMIVLICYMIYFKLKDAEPVKTGFFCDDDDLKHPWREETVYWKYLRNVYYVAPLVVILVTELLMSLGLRSSCFARFGRVIHVYTLYIFGLIATRMLTEFTKRAAGRPRPHFLQVCNPVYEGRCESGTFVSDYVCAGNRELFATAEEAAEKADYARMSFVSGHASEAGEMAVFLTLYLHMRFGRKIGGMSFAYFFALIILWTWAGFVCISRVTDYRHFVGDVVAGFALGAFIQYVNVWVVGKDLLEDDDEDAEYVKPPGNSDPYQRLV